MVWSLVHGGHQHYSSEKKGRKEKKNLLVAEAMNTPGQAVMAVDAAKLKKKRRKKKNLATLVDMNALG